MAEQNMSWVAKEHDVNYHCVTPASLLLNLDEFLSQVAQSKNGRSLNEIVATEEKAMQTALFLLKNLPPSRSAALAYLAHGLSKQVLHFVQSNEPQRNKASTLEFTIETLLGELIEESPEAWSPLVAHWSVEQLGKWSVEWESILITQNGATLDEKVATWLACGPVNSLANLTVACVVADPDNTVAALLEASVNIGQPLDWLVAHVGCSFPCTIVTRVISLGLDNFAGSNPTRANKQLLSANKILNHLGQRHFNEIRDGLNCAFMRTFKQNASAEDKAVIPFLLRLASSSDSTSILNAFAANIPSIIAQAKHFSVVESMVSWWVPKYFPTVSHLKDLLTTLLLEVSGGESWSLLGYLIKSHRSQLNGEILDQLLSQMRIFTFKLKKKSNIPLLNALSLHVKDYLYVCSDSETNIKGNSVISLVKWVIVSESVDAVKKLSHLFYCMIAQQGPEVAVSLLKLLIYCHMPINDYFLHLANVTIFCLLKQQAIHKTDFMALSSTIGDSLNCRYQLKAGEGDIVDTLRKWKALISHVAKSNRTAIIRTNLSLDALTLSLQFNVCQLAKLINVPTIGDKSFEIISDLPLERPMSLSHLFMLGQSVVYYFYTCLQLSNQSEKLRGVALCNKVFAQLSQSPLGHSLLLRLLFESAFLTEWSYLLGSHRKARLQFKEVNDTLLRTNLQYGCWVKLPMSHNSIFHAGKIGRGQTVRKENSELPLQVIAVNTQLLLNALSTCCRAQGSSPGSTTIALLLVEYISPDIMFNGFPWPEENIKFTFERDLEIKKTFDEFPFVWHLLELVARNRPALCYCSVLVRALTAAYTAYWNTFSSTLSPKSSDTLPHTKCLLEIMMIGQFLPDCFSVLPSLVDELAPHELVCVLQDVWTYLRNNTPSPDRWLPLSSGIYNRPAEFTDPRYIDRTRKLIMIHIESLGHLLPGLIHTISPYK